MARILTPPITGSNWTQYHSKGPSYGVIKFQWTDSFWESQTKVTSNLYPATFFFVCVSTAPLQMHHAFHEAELWFHSGIQKHTWREWTRITGEPDPSVYLTH